MTSWKTSILHHRWTRMETDRDKHRETRISQIATNRNNFYFRRLCENSCDSCRDLSFFIRVHLCSSVVSFAFAALLLVNHCRSASAQTLSNDALKRIQFDQKRGAQISLDLAFRDENGKTVRLGDFFGKKPAILVLGYYRCPMLCSFVLNGMIGSLQDIPWEIGNQFDIINVSIDPEETPALAAAKKESYVKRYGHSEAAAGWHFLTGDEPAIRKLADEVGFGYAYDAQSKQYAHPSGLVILTPDGKVSQYLSGVVFSTPQLNKALVTASSRQVGSPLQQLYLLCFHYSPITGNYGSLIMLVVRVTGVLTFVILAALTAPATKTG
jgi:protein SCO1/2